MLTDEPKLAKKVLTSSYQSTQVSKQVK